MTYLAIRKKFQKYFHSKGHLLTPSASLVPKGDKSLLFVNAGMNPFKNYFLGRAAPPHPAISSIQKCLRAGGKHNDLEAVGISPHHHTFFEMMGCFSFGSYFKKEACFFAYDFLTRTMGLPKDRLWVSVFKEDLATAQIWKKNHGFPNEKIFLLGEKDNFWRMGESGPCGPCSEIYYYPGDKKNPGAEKMLEVWNLVFMEFNETPNGEKARLPKPCIDTGMGMERLMAILQGVEDNYHTELFTHIIQGIEEASSKKYPGDIPGSDLFLPFRVVADHARAVSFLIADGVKPSNTGAGYVLRRILRRALFYSRKLHPENNLLAKAAEKNMDWMRSIYPELKQNKHIIYSLIHEESVLFQESLKAGKTVFLQKIKALSGKKMEPALIWELYSTYGFPPDLTRLLAREHGMAWPATSLQELKKQFEPRAFKKKAGPSPKNFLKQIFHTPLSSLLNKKTRFTGYEQDKEEGAVQLIVSEEGKPLPHLKSGERGWLVLNRSCFYPEGGGAIGDIGSIWNEEGHARVQDTQSGQGVIFHKVQMEKGEIKKAQSVKMEVDTHRRRQIAASHSATHLLHQALRDSLQNKTKQMGSLVEAGRLRFDFYSPEALSAETVQEIEARVRHFIQGRHPSRVSLETYETAVKKGAVFLENEVYDKKVRVIQIGKSRELCGGIHVKNSREIGGFKILHSTGVKAGVRRFIAYTGRRLKNWEQSMAAENKSLRKYLNWPLSTPADTKNPFIQWIELMDQKSKTLKKILKNILLDKKENISLPEDFKIPEGGNQLCETELSPLLCRQNEELRQYMGLPLISETKTALLPLIQKKATYIQSLKSQIKNISKKGNIHDWLQNKKTFSIPSLEGELCTVQLPLEDRKWLVETGDALLSRCGKRAIVVVGGGKLPEQGTPFGGNGLQRAANSTAGSGLVETKYSALVRR